jgi:hypothetical protein
MYSSAMRVYEVKFSARRDVATVAVYEYSADDSLWHIYEVLGIGDALWVREVDTYNKKIVVFPRRL